MNMTGNFESAGYFAPIDYCVLVVTLVASMAIGIYFGFFSKSLKTAEDYLVGGHKLKIVPVAVSLMARYDFVSFQNRNFFQLNLLFLSFSQLSTFSITVIPAETYQFGWQIMLSVPALILVMLLTNYVSLPVFYSNNIENCYVVCIRLLFFNKIPEKFTIIDLCSILKCVLERPLGKFLRQSLLFSHFSSHLRLCTFLH